MRHLVFVISFFFLLGLLSSSQARIVERYSYGELFDKSDLVVIAEAITKTADTKEKTYFPGLVYTDKQGKQHRCTAVGVETKFAVSKVLKGDSNIKEFVLHHYRNASPQFAPDGIPIMGGASVVSFDPSDNKRRNDTLLFLIREKDGRYAPATNQTDPNDSSIFSIERTP